MISEFPLFCFTTLAGLAAGAYVISAAFPAGKDSKRPWLFPLVCLALLAVGLLFLPFHLGRPERMLIALTQPGAMIAQEAYWSIGLGIVLLIDLIMCAKKGAAPRALRIVGIVLAVGLTVVMANAYFRSYAVEAWASWETFPLYLLGNAAMGAALLALFEAKLTENATYLTTTAALSALAVVAITLEALHFAGIGTDMMPLIVGAVLAAAAAVLQFMVKLGKINGKTGAWMAFACVFVGIACARWGFYAVYTL